jgi:phytoene synthase
MDARVALLRERLEEIYDGRLELPRPESRSEPQHALHAFARSVRRYEVPRQHFVDLAEALRRDQVVARYATWTSLERHCQQTAGSVALALSAVFGVTHSGAGDYALKLAAAMRLTAILRDLKADRDRGTVYLPLEDLARFRYSERDLAQSTVNENFRALVRFEIGRARQLFRDGAEGLCWLGDDGSRLAVSVLTATAAALLDAIERRGCDVFTRTPVLSAGQKLRRLPVAWSLSRRRPGERLPNVFRAPR